MRMKISCPLTLTLSHQGAREKRTKVFKVPSLLMREGEDEGESPRFDMPWHVATLIKEWVQYIMPLQLFNLL
jgi:hypothetical protein